MDKQIFSLINSDEWPEAVDPERICDLDSESDKKERAEVIIDMLPSATDKKFLDFGCGEGHVAQQIQAKHPMGYDIHRCSAWNENQTTDWQVILNNGPYDLILAYDVLDHCNNPVDALKKIKQAKSDKGLAFIRIHPWSSRHGGHLYHSINKAYAHLILKDEEIIELGGRVLSPRNISFNYRQWFKEADLRVAQSDFKNEFPEEFFKHPIIKKRLEEAYNGSPPTNLLHHSFVDLLIQ